MLPVTQKEYSRAICRKWHTCVEDNDLDGNNLRYHFDSEGSTLGYTVNDREYYLLNQELCTI